MRSRVQQMIGKASALSPNAPPGKTLDEETQQRLERMFANLAGTPDAEVLGPDGVIRLMEAELEVNPETDVEALVILDLFDTQSLLDISRQEFTAGMRKLQVREFAALKQMLPQLTEDILTNPPEFKRFFRGVFQRARSGSTKVIPKELAIALLPIVMAGESKRTRHLERFTEYLQTRSDLKFISADLWLGFLNFSLQIDADLSNFDTNGAWPLVLDDFVAASKVKTH